MLDLAETRAPTIAPAGSDSAADRAVDAWLRDRRRPGRLAASAVVACLLMGALGIGLTLAARAAPAPTRPKRKPIPVVLVDTAPPPRPPEPPPPQTPAVADEPAPMAIPHASMPAGGTPPPAGAAPPGGSEPSEPGGSDPYAGDSHSNGPPGPAMPLPAAPPPAPPPPPPPPAGPIRVTENVTPPQPISMPSPPYPESAKAAGVEGTVVVKYVVDESGAVTSVEALKGPPELASVCVATVRSWRFKPAVSDGHPVSVIRQARFPFRIRT